MAYAIFKNTLNKIEAEFRSVEDGWAFLYIIGLLFQPLPLVLLAMGYV